MNTGNMGHGRAVARLAMILLVSLCMALASAALAEEAGTASTDEQFGPITPEHTLWRIASENLPDQTVTVYQFMLALVDSNPHAFIAGNANLMRSGVMLKLPSAEAALAVPADAARRQLQQQGEWLAALSSEEVRAIRLGETAAVPPPVSEPLPASESDLAVEPAMTADTAALANESELASPPTDATDDFNEAATTESRWQADAASEDLYETGGDAQSEAEIVSQVETQVEVEAEARPELEPEPVMEMEPRTPTAGADSPGQTTANPDDLGPGKLTWLLGLIGLAVLGLMALLVWRRKHGVAGIPQAELATEPSGLSPSPSPSPSLEAEPRPAPESRPLDDRPAPAPVAPAPGLETPKSPGLAKPVKSEHEEDDAWASFEASVLDQADSAERKAAADPDEHGRLAPASEEAPSHQRSAAAEETGKPTLDEDIAVDFGELAQGTFDELVLSSDVDLTPDPEPDPSTESIDLDLNLNSPAEEDTQAAWEAKLEAELEAEPGTEGEARPAQSESMSDNDAEISLDLAQAMANGSDREYARELLDEIIAMGSSHMAARAREIRDSMSP